MASLDNSQELDTSALLGEYDELYQDHSDTDEHEKEDASKNVVDESDDDEKGADGAGDSNTNKKCKIENDDDEYDLTKYDGTCDKCGGRTSPDVDHIKDLLERTVTSKHPHNSSYRLQHHWPHFADFNRLMQFLCPICRLHFTSAFQFAVHTVKNQTEDGFKNDGPEQITWTEEIGVQHKELLNKLISFIKEVDTNGPKVEQIAMINQFVCREGCRYFEMDYRREKFADHILPSVHDREEPVDCMLMEYEMRLVTNDNPDAYKVEETDQQQAPYGSVAYLRKLDEVFYGNVGKLSDLTQKRDVDGKNVVEQVKKDTLIPASKRSQTRDGYICPDCDDSSHSVRHHINEVLWGTQKERTSHINYFLKNRTKSETAVCEEDVKTINCIYCPVCKLHVRTSRSYELFFNHLRKHEQYSHRKPNKFVADHFDVMQTITNLFVDRIKGDLSTEAMNAALNKQFFCPNGGVYLESESLFHWWRKPTWKRRQSSAYRRHQTKIHQKRRLETRTSGPRGSYGVQRQGAPFPSLMSVQPRGYYAAPMRMGPAMPGFLCYLCGFQTMFRDGLYQHIYEALFQSNRVTVRTHLGALPEKLIYTMTCNCPGCGHEESSFANNLQHLGRGAARNEQHHLQAKGLVNQFLGCMTGIIDLHGVTRYIENTFKMGAQRRQ